MDKISCPDCNSKLRKFKGGVICVKNHKFVEGTELHDIYYGTNIYNNKMLCPECKQIGSQFSFDENCLQCKNGHQWGID